MKERYIGLLILFLLIVYNSQGVLYGRGGGISQLTLVITHLIGIIYFFKSLLISSRKNLFFKAWTALLVLNIIGFIFTGNVGNPIHFSMLKGVLMSLLVFYPFYYLSSKNLIKAKDLILFLLILLPITISQFYLSAEQILQERISDSTNVVNNIAYDFVWLLPYVFLVKKQRALSITLSLIVVFFIIQGAKRGAILVGAVGVIFYVLYLLRTVSRKNRIRGYFVAIVGLLVISFYTYNFFIQNEYLIERLQQLEQGNSSGRDVIYANLFNAWYNSDNFLTLLFGYGFASSIFLSGTGNLAHNDWLELLTNFGLVGISVYIVLFYSLYKITFSPYWSIDKKLLLAAIFLMSFSTTLFSMGYTSGGGYLKAVLLAYLLGNKFKTIV